MTQRMVIYFDGIDSIQQASYGYSIDEVLRGQQDTTFISIDAISEVGLLKMVEKGMLESSAVLLIVDTCQGQSTKGLFALINKLLSKKGDLFWLGDHPQKKKALMLSKGVSLLPDELEPAVRNWIKQS